MKKMNTAQPEQQSLGIGQEELLAVVRAMIGGSGRREDDEHPLPPGPWDPVVRVALERVIVFGPHPDPWKLFGPGPRPWQSMESGFRPGIPWRALIAVLAAKHPEIWDIIGGGPGVGTEVTLNPQPLPPRFAFLVSLVQAVASRAELLQDIAEATRSESEQQDIVGRYLARLTEDICGNGFRFKWPLPGPRPYWLIQEVSGIDLVVMAAQFSQVASETYSRELRQCLKGASATLAEVGLAQMR